MIFWRNDGVLCIFTTVKKDWNFKCIIDGFSLSQQGKVFVSFKPKLFNYMNGTKPKADVIGKLILA